MEYYKYLLNSIFSFNNIFIKSLVALWLYFSGIHIYVVAIACLLLIDVITGIFASRKNGIPFTSRLLKKGLIEKLALYLVILVAAFLLEIIFKTVFTWESYFIVFFVSVLISTYELISIFENVHTIDPSLTFLKSLINLSHKLHKRAIKVAEEKVDDSTID